MYLGKCKHLRLFKYIGPKMWNFTGCALLIPKIDDKIKQLLLDPVKSTTPQKDPSSVTLKDLLYESDPEKVKLWDNARNEYILQLLDDGLNKVYPEAIKSSKPLKDMSEKECAQCISKAKFEKDEESMFNFIVKPKVVTDRNKGHRTDINILELSLDENSTIAGTFNILHQFAVECKLLLSEDKAE